MNDSQQHVVLKASIEEANTLYSRLAKAANERAQAFARLPYSLAPIEDDVYLRRIDRVMGRVYKRIERRRKRFYAFYKARVIAALCSMSADHWNELPLNTLNKIAELAGVFRD